MNRTKFGETHRQIAIGFEPVLEDLHMTRAIHRLQCKNALIGIGIVRVGEGMRGFHREHIFLIPTPMA